ncbi:MAG TPA: Clp protease N-terminal domain-containing protein [Ktedonobacteraceae bacterium]|nr:Clp protease N-terminal domain-containing protein [Ktedonobacteraceae bacterium]
MNERDRFDKFTERARRVLSLAQEEAQRFQHNYIGTEHLLLGLVREGEGVAAKVLLQLGVELNKIRGTVEFIIGRGDRIVLGQIGLTPRAKKVIELAVDEARRLNHHYIGTEHILLGLLREGEGIAAGVLESLGVRLEQARRETLAVLGVSSSEMQTTSPPTPEESASLLAESEPKLICPYCGAYLAEGESSLICSHCGTHCPGYFHYCFNCGERLVYE